MSNKMRIMHILPNIQCGKSLIIVNGSRYETEDSNTSYYLQLIVDLEFKSADKESPWAGRLGKYYFFKGSLVLRGNEMPSNFSYGVDGMSFSQAWDVLLKDIDSYGTISKEDKDVYSYIITKTHRKKKAIIAIIAVLISTILLIICM